ncbi:MAG: arginine--tRNA ligase [Bacteroidia bacterium]|nr:arginine--tRNA ligase [Bacteroidia bacterium]
MNLKQILTHHTQQAVLALYGQEIPAEKLQFQETRKEFDGDITLTVFSLITHSKKSPELTAQEIGNKLLENSAVIDRFNVVKGFLNLSFKAQMWLEVFQEIAKDKDFGNKKITEHSPVVMIEYPSPNTNKPLHLGHLRNIFLGYSMSQILQASGNKVVHACLYNDRGTNISKSMLAWMKSGKQETPASSGKKGDHLVGDYYVEFANAYKQEIADLMAGGLTKEDAEKQSKLNKEVADLTVKWENNDAAVRELWKTMNAWVYEGFEVTYNWLGIKPDKFYYESDVYHLGKETVKEGLEKGVFYQKEDGSVWIDLTAEGLDQKVVLRSNGTTVYITQDIATANEKDRDFKLDKSIYVVGNEQEYHFKVLFSILKKLGRPYADNLFHLSYGMVELPNGKMKSREGTVVDADDLIAGMIEAAREKTAEKGKNEGQSEKELTELYKTIGLGALKYFILKVDAKKRIIFNPEESIETEGHTGPFIQYSHARICSILRKGTALPMSNSVISASSILPKELALIRQLTEFPEVIKVAGESYNPALLANYVYELAKEFNQYYHDVPMLKEEREEVRSFRLELASKVANVIKKSMNMLGIEVPERM